MNETIDALVRKVDELAKLAKRATARARRYAAARLEVDRAIRRTVERLIHDHCGELASIRKAARLKQMALAAKVGVPATYLSWLENGKIRNVNTLTVLRIVRAYAELKHGD